MVSLYCNNSLGGDRRPTIVITYNPPPAANTNEIRLGESLSFSPDMPNDPPQPNTNVTARFVVKNVSGRVIAIPALQVKMKGPSGTDYDFPAVSNITLNPGDTYTYSQNRTLPEGGLYFGQAMFSDGATWYRAYIEPGSGLVNQRQYLVRVNLPPPEKRTQGPNGPNGTAGEPVNTSTGNFAAPWTDATLPDVGLSLLFGRTFNSRDTDHTGWFGQGWAATYDEHIVRRADESIIYLRGDGQQVAFTAEFIPTYSGVGNDGTATLVATGSYSTQDGFDLTLRRDGAGGWTLTDTDQTVRVFDDSGRLLTIQDRYGTHIDLTYSGPSVSSVATVNQHCDVTWTANRVTMITCPTGALMYVYSLAGELIRATNLAGETITYEYDAAHRVTKIVDGNNRLVAENVYDALGRVVQQREGITAWTSFDYGSGVRATTYTDPRGQVLTDTYDTRDRLIKRVDALGNTATYQYDADDHLIAQTNALGHAWMYTYDTAGNILTETDPLSQTWTYTYNARHQRLSQTDPLGHTTLMTYTGDLLQSSSDPLGSTRSYISTPNGLITRLADELGHVTQRDYTPTGQIKTETDPNGATTVLSG